MRLSAHSQSVERQRAVGGAHGRARSRLEGACPRHRLLAGGGRGSQIGERQSALAAKAWGLKHAVDHAALSVLSRLPIERSSSVALTIVQDELRQALLADMNIDGRRVLVANTHLCWRPQWTAARKTQVDVLLPAIERHGARDATLLCGDFNDDPDSAPLRAVIDSPCGFATLNLVAAEPLCGPRFAQGPAHRLRAPLDCAVVFTGAGGFASDHFGVFCTLDLH